MRSFPRAVALALSVAGCLSPARAASEDDLPVAVYPPLPRSAPDAAGFAPPGWVIEARASGDLDGDGIGDLALVLHETSPRKMIPTGSEPGGPTFDSNPRILAVAFGSRDGGYRLGLENHALIPRRTSSTHDDAFEDPGSLSIRSGVVQLTLSYFASAGGWDMGNRTLKFRHRDGGLVLVGCEAINVHRASGETRTTSVNFLTGRAWVRTGSISTERGTVRRYALDGRAPPAIAEVGDGLDFDLLARARPAR